MLFRKNLKHRIIITSNCQTNGIADSLQYLVNDKSINIVPEWKLGHSVESFAQKNRELLVNSTIWITSFPEDQIKAILPENLSSGIKKIIRIPEIHFDAFHPDLTYIMGREGILESPLVHYHSKIILLSFLENLSVKKVMKLFNGTLYNELGYFDYWNQSIQRLRQDFLNSDLDYYEFIKLLNLDEIFMHSINHPNKEVLNTIAWLIANELEDTPKIRVGGLKHILKDEIFEYGPVWPVYPEIANYYGNEGSYLFRAQGGKIFNLKEFIEAEYEIFSKQAQNQFYEKSYYFSPEFVSAFQRHL